MGGVDQGTWSETTVALLSFKESRDVAQGGQARVLLPLGEALLDRSQAVRIAFLGKARVGVQVGPQPVEGRAHPEDDFIPLILKVQGG